MTETDSSNIHVLSKELVQAQVRIIQLEQQNKQLLNCLKLYYTHCKNDHQINYINETAKKLLEV